MHIKVSEWQNEDCIGFMQKQLPFLHCFIAALTVQKSSDLGTPITNSLAIQSGETLLFSKLCQKGQKRNNEYEPVIVHCMRKILDPAALTLLLTDFFH